MCLWWISSRYKVSFVWRNCKWTHCEARFSVNWRGCRGIVFFFLEVYTDVLTVTYLIENYYYIFSGTSFFRSSISNRLSWEKSFIQDQNRIKESKRQQFTLCCWFSGWWCRYDCRIWGTAYNEGNIVLWFNYLYIDNIKKNADCWFLQSPIVKFSDHEWEAAEEFSRTPSSKRREETSSLMSVEDQGSSTKKQKMMQVKVEQLKKKLFFFCCFTDFLFFFSH